MIAQVLGRLSQGTVFDQKTVPTGTAETLGDGVVGEILVAAHMENTAPIYVGSDNTISTTAKSIQMAPGSVYTFNESNLNRLYCIAAVSGQKLSYAGLKAV